MSARLYEITAISKMNCSGIIQLRGVGYWWVNISHCQQATAQKQVYQKMTA